MQGHTKRHLIKGKAYAVRKSQEKPVTYEEAMTILLRGRPQYSVILKGLRSRDDLSQRELGEMIGVAQANISLMESGKRAIGKTVAHRLAKVFKTNWKLFL